MRIDFVILLRKLLMTLSHRPLRSALYIPGSKPRALEKARNLPTDSIIFDLEGAKYQKTQIMFHFYTEAGLKLKVMEDKIE